MKEKEAPEKIYLVIDPVWGSMSVNYNRNDTNNIEYIREDVFIEKAISWLKEQKEMVGISFQEDFIERFKNYMKGE